MDNVLVTVGAITSAMRLVRLLESETRYGASVVHTPSEINNGGCSYSIRTNYGAVEHLQRLSQQYSLPMKKVYAIKTVDGECVYHALS